MLFFNPFAVFRAPTDDAGGPPPVEPKGLPAPEMIELHVVPGRWFGLYVRNKLEAVQRSFPRTGDDVPEDGQPHGYVRFARPNGTPDSEIDIYDLRIGRGQHVPLHPEADD